MMTQTWLGRIKHLLSQTWDVKWNVGNWSEAGFGYWNSKQSRLRQTNSQQLPAWTIFMCCCLHVLSISMCCLHVPPQNAQNSADLSCGTRSPRCLKTSINRWKLEAGDAGHEHVAMKGPSEYRSNERKRIKDRCRPRLCGIMADYVGEKPTGIEGT